MEVSNKCESNEWLNKSITTSHDFLKKEKKLSVLAIIV